MGLEDYQPLIDVSAKEFNDDSEREEIHPLYHKVSLDYDKVHGEALRAFEQLKKRYL